MNTSKRPATSAASQAGGEKQQTEICFCGKKFLHVGMEGRGTALGCTRGGSGGVSANMLTCLRTHFSHTQDMNLGLIYYISRAGEMSWESPLGKLACSRRTWVTCCQGKLAPAQEPDLQPEFGAVFRSMCAPHCHTGRTRKRPVLGSGDAFVLECYYIRSCC